MPSGWNAPPAFFRTAADDAVAENERAYQRAVDAIERAEAAEREADLAWWWAENR